MTPSQQAGVAFVGNGAATHAVIRVGDTLRTACGKEPVLPLYREGPEHFVCYRCQKIMGRAR